MITFERSNRLADAVLAFEVLKNLKNFYPGFEYWYANKVVPAVVTGDDILICAKEHNKIVGVALGKKRQDEVKLRCIRVDESYQKRGTGLHLVDKMLVALGHDKPHCTVSEEMLHDFSRPFINHYKFALNAVSKGMYRRHKLEYVFNGDETAPTNIDDGYFSPGTTKVDARELALQEEVFGWLGPR